MPKDEWTSIQAKQLLVFFAHAIMHFYMRVQMFNVNGVTSKGGRAYQDVSDVLRLSKETQKFLFFGNSSPKSSPLHSADFGMGSCIIH